MTLLPTIPAPCEPIWQVFWHPKGPWRHASSPSSSPSHVPRWDVWKGVCCGNSFSCIIISNESNWWQQDVDHFSLLMILQRCVQIGLLTLKYFLINSWGKPLTIPKIKRDLVTDCWLSFRPLANLNLNTTWSISVWPEAFLPLSGWLDHSKTKILIVSPLNLFSSHSCASFAYSMKTISSARWSGIFSNKTDMATSMPLVPGFAVTSTAQSRTFFGNQNGPDIPSP